MYKKTSIHVSFIFYLCMAKSLVHQCPKFSYHPPFWPRLWDLSKGFPTNDLTVEVLPARPWPKSTKRPRRHGKFSSIASVVQGCPTRCNKGASPSIRVFKKRNKQKWTKMNTTHRYPLFLLCHPNFNFSMKYRKLTISAEIENYWATPIFMWTSHVSVQQLLSGDATESGTKDVPPNCLHQFNEFEHPELKLGTSQGWGFAYKITLKSRCILVLFAEKHVGLLQSMAWLYHNTADLQN